MGEDDVPGQRIGSLIGASFGLVYVLVNAGQRGPAACWVLRGVALVLFATVVARLVAERGRPGPGAAAGDDRPPPFGRNYWLIVVVEFVALFTGVRLLSGPLDHPGAGVAWVSLVVGTHFFALAVHFGLRLFHVLGVAVTTCGAVGLVLAFTAGSAAAVATVGGVLPGFVLLGFGLWGVGVLPGPGRYRSGIESPTARSGTRS